MTTTTTKNTNNVYKPVFYRLQPNADNAVFFSSLNSDNAVKYDTIWMQLVELLACRNPSLSKNEIKNSSRVEDYLNKANQTLETYGVWVYYPWKNHYVHILDEEEFIEVRTNRNKNKITLEKQSLLRSKKIGVVGLSVGRSVATTIALERIAGEIRLADFDEIELSNLNRIKAPLVEMGLNKAISTAREIAEIDPYIIVKCYTEGLSEGNMDVFFNDGAKLDLFVEECDDIAVKITSRLKCKALGIPVVMETNDNCIVDIERFDLEPEREILHGKLEGTYVTGEFRMIEQNRMVLLQKMFDIDRASKGMLRSLSEIGKSLSGLPQLGSEVFKGSGVLASLIRDILLGNQKKSVRLTFDANESE
jgi:molybdopterin/thiamine biosynthesis adenylyltransferase